MDPLTETAVGAATAAQPLSTFDAATLLRLLNQGGLTVYPLALCSVIAVAIMVQQLWRYRWL